MQGNVDSRRAVEELVVICRQEARSGWPVWDRWRNEDVWHETFARLTQRIEEDRVETDRPLGPLARKTALRLFLREQERQRRFQTLSDGQLHRFRQSEEVLPDEGAERSWQAELLRETLIRLCGEGRLDQRDVLILLLRYVEEWRAEEVAASLSMGPAAIRQICSRRLRLLRGEMLDLGLDPAVPS